MANFVLVHGAFHGAWCWAKLQPELTARGHRVLAMDMPGCGEDTTPPEQVSLVSCASRIGETLEQAGKDVILVGHSMGATLAAQAAEHHLGRIRRLVFLAGVIPKDGESLYTLLQMLADPAAAVKPAPPPGDPWDGPVQQPALDRAPEVFYNDCTAEDVAFALPRLRAQANAPRREPLSLSQDFYCLPRVFIGCARDNANTPARQRATCAMFPCERELSLPTGHSPFFSQPSLLADTLAGLA